MSDSQEQQSTEGQKPEDGSAEQQEQTFTQADIDRIVRERVKREREKYADYDELKAKAGEKATAEERIAALEKEIERANREALKRRVQAAHGIPDEDADLFLTGTDEETLTAQAKRLAARESERKKQGNHVPKEGTHTEAAGSSEGAFARELFGAD